MVGTVFQKFQNILEIFRNCWKTTKKWDQKYFLRPAHSSDRQEWSEKWDQKYFNRVAHSSDLLQCFNSKTPFFFWPASFLYSSYLLQPPIEVADGVSDAGYSCNGIGRRLGADGAAAFPAGADTSRSCDDAGAAGGVAGWSRRRSSRRREQQFSERWSSPTVLGYVHLSTFLGLGWPFIASSPYLQALWGLWAHYAIWKPYNLLNTA